MTLLFVLGLGIFLLGMALGAWPLQAPTSAVVMTVGAILVIISPFVPLAG
jgi:hypothetical protein